MTTLTKNRILQQGDEYLEGESWKEIPKADFGLQIMFTKYQQVRRPAEKPSPAATPTPAASPQQADQGKRKLASPLNDPGITSVRGQPSPQDNGADKGAAGSGRRLPTVVSKKAHKEIIYAHLDPAHGKSTGVATVTGKAMPSNGNIQIAVTEPGNIWIGRNGTFNVKGINLNVTPRGESIQVRPIGKRGLAQNALIEFPTSIIPQMIDWLLRHEPKPKT